jgi:hypothetical protein
MSPVVCLCDVNPIPSTRSPRDRDPARGNHRRAGRPPRLLGVQTIDRAWARRPPPEPGWPKWPKRIVAGARRGLDSPPSSSPTGTRRPRSTRSRPYLTAPPGHPRLLARTGDAPRRDRTRPARRRTGRRLRHRARAHLAEPDGIVLPFALAGTRDLLERHPRHLTAHAALLADILDVLAGSSPLGTADPLRHSTRSANASYACSATCPATSPHPRSAPSSTSRSTRSGRTYATSTRSSAHTAARKR